jgi:hypothetical protein
MASLIYTANTVAWVLTILIAIAGTAVKRNWWGILYMSAVASTSIWGTVLLQLGAPVWPYIAYALILLIFYFEVYIFIGLVQLRRRKL